MLSVARSRYTNFSQFVFLASNALGLVTGVIYNANTPDLYQNNAHHKIGWIATWIMSAHTVVGFLRSCKKLEKPRFIPIKSTAYRWSQDSGMPASPRASDVETPVDEFEDLPMEEKRGLLGGNNAVSNFFTSKIQALLSSRLMSWLDIPYEIVDRSSLILGFIALTTGFVTYGGHFRDREVLSGLAHFIKGGIFFWYGLLCLGRVMGSFADLGWSWNVKPPALMVGSRKASVASAEFFESLLIFIYGCMNVFLEHLGSEDGKWSAGDLEHMAISVMFFGGGLCGMLIESKRVRSLLNSSFVTTNNTPEAFVQSVDVHHEPRHYGSSTNPLPAIIILLLGIMMSSHTQVSPVSTMMHKLWGTLFFGAALARGVTYITVYLSPPTSYLPSRPPSEVVVSFCLISGGLLFMSSASDIIHGMEMYGIHAMVFFTIVMGLSAFLMAWEIVVLAIKGWAVRRGQ